MYNLVTKVYELRTEEAANERLADGKHVLLAVFYDGKQPVYIIGELNTEGQARRGGMR